MFGTGLVKGLGVTIKRFVDTYVDDVKRIPSRYAYGTDMIRQTPEEKGIFTIQYPEEKRQLPERFRYIPMLIYDTPKGEDRCTACGICAKVCPPQCIWIVRHKDANGKPEPRAGEFYIDASICMSCGFCAEFCPFDAIKMNHDYELAVYDRFPGLIYNMAELTVPVEYYAALYPTQFVEEEARRAEEEAKKAKKPARGAKPAAPAAPAPPVAPAAAAATGATTLSAEELERRRAEAKARVAARKGEAVAPAAAAPAPAAAAAAPAPAVSAIAAGSPFAKMAANPAKTSGGYTVDEIAARRAQAYARYQARKGADAKQLHGAGGAPAAPLAPAAPAAAPPQAAAPASEAPVATAAAPATPAVAAGSPFAKAAADPSKTSGGVEQDELARKRAEAYARYQARKGADAKQLHGADQPVAAAPAAPAPVAAAPSPAPAPVEPAAPPPPRAAVKPTAAAGSHFAKMAADPAKTSGGYTVDEIATKRAEAYARYKARKGADAKDLESH